MHGRTARRLAGTTLLVGVALTACSAEDAGPAPASSQSSPGATPTMSADRGSSASPTPTTAEARTEVQAYLDAWRTQGPAAASRAYLAPDQQVADDADAPHLASGTVTEVTGARPTPEGLMVQVSLDLSFDGDPVAWGEGTNERFVTFRWRGVDIPHEMTFATSP